MSYRLPFSFRLVTGVTQSLTPAVRSRAAPSSGVAGASSRRPPPPSAVTVTRLESGTADRRQFYAPEHLAKGSQTDVLVSHVDSPDTFYTQQLGVHAEVGQRLDGDDSGAPVTGSNGELGSKNSLPIIASTLKKQSSLFLLGSTPLSRAENRWS